MFKRRTFSPVLAALSLGSIAMTDPSVAQERSTERTVSVSATGSVNAAPDIAYISTGVATEGTTAREALDANNKAMRAVIDGLKALGLDAKDIQTSQVGVEPRHQHFKDGRPPAIVGYRVVNQLRIVQRDLAKLGETLDKSITLGANQLGGINFEVSKAETLKDEARRLAMANALRRAQLYAGAAGSRVDRVITISETVAGGPRPVHAGARMAMAETMPVEAGEQALSVTVHVTWALK